MRSVYVNRSVVLSEWGLRGGCRHQLAQGCWSLAVNLNCGIEVDPLDAPLMVSSGTTPPRPQAMGWQVILLRSPGIPGWSDGVAGEFENL